MAFAHAESRQDAISAINITPLVDVMLVMLVIFMITAPLMSHKTKIQLPQTPLQKTGPTAPPPMTVAVTEEGRFFLNDEPMTRELLESRLSVEAQKDPQPAVDIRADKTTRYRYVNDVVNIAQVQGMRKVGFVATPERN